MASVFDAASYIIKKNGTMSAMKLQKLVYYAQAWSLVWDDRPLFPEAIEAWANGPVCPALYKKHQGHFLVGKGMVGGDPSRIDNDGIETIDAILKHYGSRSSQWLIDLTHQEAPWKNARVGLGPGDRGTRRITHAAMSEYYGSL
jgi:uncharacterized phage-associated protein